MSAQTTRLTAAERARVAELENHGAHAAAVQAVLYHRTLHVRTAQLARAVWLLGGLRKDEAVVPGQAWATGLRRFLATLGPEIRDRIRRHEPEVDFDAFGPWIENRRQETRREWPWDLEHDPARPWRLADEGDPTGEVEVVWKTGGPRSQTLDRASVPDGYWYAEVSAWRTTTRPAAIPSDVSASSGEPPCSDT